MAKTNVLESVAKVQVLVNRFLLTTREGQQVSLNFAELTPAQERGLRTLVAPRQKRQAVKKATRRSGQPRKSVNYAQGVLWTRNGWTEVL